MVVISIIGLLAAIAVPMYTQYTNRVTVLSTLNIANQVDEYVQQYYATHNTMPTSGIPFGSTTISTVPSGGQAYTAAGNIGFAAYQVSTSATQAAYYMTICVTGLTGITGYLTPGSANAQGGYACYVSLGGFSSTTGVHTRGCGNDIWYWFNSNWIPANLLPSSCQCANTQTFWNNLGSSGC
jgi:type II secretory pathway pseudopilin PulG